MSGATDLARLTATIDTANELLLSDQIKMMDVGDGVMRPTNAKAVADLAAQMTGAMIYLTTASGLAGTVSGSYFTVPASTSGEYLILYRNEGGVALEIKRYPSSEALKAVSDLVTTTNYSTPEVEVMVISDQEGGKLSTLTSKRLETPGFDVIAEPGDKTIIGDSEGAASVFVDAERAILGALEVQPTSMPGFYITDEDGGVIQDFNQNFLVDSAEGAVSPFDGGLLFMPVIATAEGGDVAVYAQGMIPHRENSDSVIASLASQDTSYSVTAPAMPVSYTKCGASAVLNLRLKSQPDVRHTMALTLKNVSVQSPAVPINILWIGDSITNFAGPYLLDTYLRELGFVPNWMGTLKSSVSSSETNTAGPLAEGRPGWESGDYTYAVTGRAQMIAVGDEASYLTMEKSDQFAFNPFVRIANGSDSPAVVRNGRVFDPAFYQSRFGFDTPDLVINTVGTNDVRDLASSAIYDAIYSNDTLMHSQILAAWPSAKVIRSVPGTSYNSTRNALWASHYAPMIRALKAAAVTVGSKVIVPPLWAMTNPEVGYAIGLAVPTGNDGFKVSDWSDNTHPSGASRQALFKALAPFVAAAKINLM